MYKQHTYIHTSEARLAWRLKKKEMESAVRVQISVEAVCIYLRNITFDILIKYFFISRPMYEKYWIRLSSLDLDSQPV